ncbi:Rab guanine nucleotide exchange factor SEC2 [Hypsizygus marmoreus]|uniref:Rab guanine nucleotide exchange factor SEC2 n=1 Tax=Hypsizygus marmoreus TaxID=39966 RepID=A0A369KFR7_HYPMA|nr:Rab guanine nucleotide exchange factor SEC2 [Hypsizygus marmoreus]
MADAPQDEHTVLKATSDDETATESPKVNGDSTMANGLKHERTRSDPDAQEMVIASLRSQIQDLFAQVTELNNKLVKSYDRVSDLEDDLHVASSTLRSSTLKISQLELERTQHLSALNTGLLVEKSHVTAELNRLMEKATEEAAQRGQAESARADIEKDLDDLSATLFGQANSMVAEARYAQHLSEQKVVEAQRALKGAEEAVGMMQHQMQALQAEKEDAERKAEEAQVTMGRGKWVERRDSASSITRSIRLLSSHLPYQEFLLFVAHLRSVHPSSPQPPAITTLLPLPFLARLLNEDSEPTVRLDLAPSLNWLSRRSVLSAIHNGQLIIEPMSSMALLQESSSYSTSTTIPGLNSSSNNISCALCGTPIFSSPELSSNHRPQPPAMSHNNSGTSSLSWPTALFKKPSHATSNSSSSNNSQPSSPRATQPYPPQVYIFRLASSSSTISSIPIPSLPRTGVSGSSSSTPPHHSDHHTSISYTSSPAPPSTIYPLCSNSWCLSRLRTTCTLWAFVRTGIVEKVWGEEVPNLPPATIAPSSNTEKPPIPPRRRGLWGMASALGERATSWGEGDKEKAKRTAQPQSAPMLEPKPAPDHRRLPPPPPTHPIVTAGHAPVRHSVPPPLPKRSDVRRQPSPTTEKSLPEVSAPAEPAAATSPTVHPPLPQRPPRRSITPANVPLPESRPHTPPVVAPGASPVVPGAAPPPLPRRAAARAPRQLADGGSRPATPVKALEVTEAPTSATETAATEGTKDASVAKPEDTNASDGDKPKDEVKASDVGVSAGNPVPSNDNDAGEEANKTVPEAAVATASPSDDTVDGGETKADSKDVDANVTEDTAGTTDAEKEDVKELVMEKEEVIDAVEPTAGGAEEVKETKSDGSDKGEEEVKGVGDRIVVASEPEKEITVEEGTDTKTDGEQTRPDDERATKLDDDKETNSDDNREVYIGDATWEERTWNEIVRLREEMFWARIGGLRQ